MKKLPIVIVILAAVVLSWLYFSGESEGVQNKDQSGTEQRGVLLLAEGSLAVVKSCSFFNPSFKVCDVVDYDFEKVSTEGKRSYIPIGILGKSDDNPGVILRVLDEFSKHFDVIITDWKVNEGQDHSSNLHYLHRVYGIWVDHNIPLPGLTKHIKPGE